MVVDVERLPAVLQRYRRADFGEARAEMSRHFGNNPFNHPPSCRSRGTAARYPINLQLPKSKELASCNARNASRSDAGSSRFTTF
jgi:hypothetical protein